MHTFTVTSQNSTGGVSNYYCIPLPLHLKIPQAVFPTITAYLYRYISKFHRRCFQLLLHTFTVTSQNSTGGVSNYYCIPLPLHLKIPQAVFPTITASLYRSVCRLEAALFAPQSKPPPYSYSNLTIFRNKSVRYQYVCRNQGQYILLPKD